MSYGLFSSGEAPLGSFAPFASFRSLIQEADGKNYLRVGSVVPASFADAKLMVKSDYVFLPQVNTNDDAGTDHCDSGAVILFTLQGSGNYRRSTDDLLTSTNETWPASYIPATPIRWTGIKFVVGAYVSGGGLFMLSSTTGLTGSWTITSIVAGAFSAPFEMWMEFAPLAPAFMVCTFGNNGANLYGIYSSPDGGATWTTRRTSATEYYRKPVCLGSGAAGRWVIPFNTLGAPPSDAYTMPADFSSALVSNALLRQLPELVDCFTDGVNIVATNKVTGADAYSVDGLDWDAYRQVALSAGATCNLNRCAGAFWKFINTSGSVGDGVPVPIQFVLRSVDGKTWFQKNTGLNYAIGAFGGVMKRGFVTQSLKIVGAANRLPTNNKHALASWNQASHIGSLLPSGATDNPFIGAQNSLLNGARFPAAYMRIK